MRMRLSNNLEYIQNLSDDLFATVDIILQKHLDGDGEEVDDEFRTDVAEEFAEEEKYLRRAEDNGMLGRIKSISGRMQSLLLRKPHKGRRKRKVRSPLVHKIRVLLRSFSQITSHGTRAFFSSNPALRKRYFSKFKESLQQFKTTFEKPTQDFQEVEEEIDFTEHLKADTRLEYSKALTSFLEEAHLFFGWLLAFYIVYFYIGGYVITKAGPTTNFFSFLGQSLENPFSYFITGIFFILFMGLTIINRFKKKDILSIGSVGGGTTVLLALFMLHF